MDTSRTSDIMAMTPYWDRVTAILGGLDSMRSYTTLYLPKHPDESDSDYRVRLNLSKFTNIYRDVTEGLATKPFEEEVGILGGAEVPKEVLEFAEDVDGSGNNLTMFSALTFFNAINYAVDWILVDFPAVDTSQVLSIADAKRLNLKPFWSHVLAVNVLEVKHEKIGSKKVLTYIRIKEPGIDRELDKVRVFERIGDTVTWSLYETDMERPIDGGVLSIGVIPMIPVITGRRDGDSWRFYPPMQDAADLQITLYQNESALEYIKHLAAYPMLAANGMVPEKSPDGKGVVKLAIGPSRVLYSKPDGAGNFGEWKYIEPNANSMEFLKKDINSTKQDLRELGRQPLTALSSQLTTVTTSIAAGKAKSAVTAWALGLKDALEQAMLITCMWMGLDYEPEVNVYTGFDNVMDDGSDLDTLNKARDRGDLSQETYWAELKRRKVLSPEFKTEDEQARILAEIPVDQSDSPEVGLSDNNDGV